MNGESEKMQLQEIIKDFREKYKLFNKGLVIGSLNTGYQIDKAFHLRVPVEIKYIARKHGLPEDKWDQIYQDLIAENVDNDIKLLLAQTMKYSIKKRNIYIEPGKFIIVLQKNQDTRIKSEIVWALGYQIRNSIEQNSGERIDKNFTHEINSIIEGSENELNATSISFLNEQIQRQCHVNDGSYREISHRKIETSIKYFKKRPQLAVTKIQQTTKTNYKNSQSEESANGLKTVSVFKNRNKKININSNKEHLPIVPDKDGSDKSIFRTTYDEVVHLYNRIKSGQTLKRKDKDEYLPSKFIGPKKKWYTHGTVKSLFIDRMIADIFLEISKKQILHENAIKLLMDCIDTLDKVEEKILGSTTKKAEIAREIVHRNRMRQNRITRIFFQGQCMKVYENDPDIVAKMASKIYKDSIIDPNEIMKIVSSEVNEVRVAAISTIYNSARRNNTILNKERFKKIERCLKDNDIKFQQFVIKILGPIDSDAIDYKNLFENCLEQLEKNVTVGDSINYINQQSKDEKRCQELFNENVVSRISYLCNRTILNEETKTYCCATINNYLERSYSNGLNDIQLINYIYLINDPQNSSELKIEALRSIVLTVAKNQHLPNFVIETLVENINHFTDQFDNFIVIALEIVSQRQTIRKVDQLATKLLDDWVIVGEGTDITFEKRSKDNSDCPSISSTVAQIFVKSLQENVRITDQSLEYLAKALNSNDKQTCILSAKCLYLALETHDIKNDILVELREHVEDTIHDVSVYSTVVYIRGLANLSLAKEPIIASHIEFLPKIYVFEDLQLGEESFSDIVNTNILFVLLNEAEHRHFEDNVFHIFDHVLLSENCNQAEVIQIIDIYSTNKDIPENTIFALENAVGIPEISNQVLKVFENLIQNGQAVGEKILQIIADNLYLSDDDRLRDKSFNLLDMANDKQDISDDISDILELERAIITIDLSRLYDSDPLTYLSVKTKEGQKLTLNGFRMLSKVIHSQWILNEEISSILLNISTNEQIIPDDITDKLVRRFNPKRVQNQFIKIFENLIKNNQNISNELSFKLEQALDNKLVSDEILLLFVFKGQKGEKLSRNIVIRILDKFLNIENQLMMQQYLSVICSAIQNEDSFDEYENLVCDQLSDNTLTLVSRVQLALIHGLEKGNRDVVNKSINGFKTLITFHKITLDKQSINALFNLATNPTCDRNIRRDINTLLDVLKLEDSEKCKLQLANLNDESNDDQFLDELVKFIQPELLEENFNKIDSIINNYPKLINKALNILFMCSNKENIPDKLLHSITVLLASTTEKNIRSLCFRLISETVKVGREFSDETISIIASRANPEEAKSILKLIAKNQSIPEEFQDPLNSLLQIDISTGIDPKCLDKFLKSIRQELDKGSALSDSSMESLLSIQVPKNDGNTNFSRKIEQQLTDIFALIIIQHPDYSSNQLIINNLEKSIMSKNINRNILNAYQVIIQTKQCQANNLSNVLDILHVEFLEFHFEILGCISLASEFMGISKIETLESNISSNDGKVRRWAFIGLRAACERGLTSETFEKKCKNISDMLEKNLHIKVIHDLDLFETVIAINYVDFSKISDEPQNRWNRELLIFDLLERFQITQGQKFNFYQTWFEIEKDEKFQDGKSDTILKLLHRIRCNNEISFNQCHNILEVLSKIDFDDAQKILLNNKNPYLDFPKEYIKNLIYQRLENKAVDIKYITDLASSIISKLGFDIGQKLIKAIEKISSLRDFEDILSFAENNNIKISDIYVENTTILGLKKSLKIKLLSNQITKADRPKLHNILGNLIDKDWTFEQLTIIFESFQNSISQERTVKERNFVDVLKILSEYEIPSTLENREKILLALKGPTESWQRAVNIIAVENKFFETGQIKNATVLIQELEQNNSSNQKLVNLIRRNLLDLIEKIKRSDLVSQVLDTTEEYGFDRNSNKQPVYITEWTRDQIRRWANKVELQTDQYRNTEDFIIEALAVIKQANLLHSGFHLTDAQILSCLVILNANSDKGRLLQVGTGEGKSTIISALAVIHALRGKNVDIVTSSPVLAERDAKETAKFYSMFDLRCSDNNDKSIYLGGQKACYKNEIVYGEVSQFQFDTLRTEYAQLKTLGDRKYGVAIVDEVDSMFLDDSSKIARLATTMSGMDQLQIIYHLLWDQYVSLHNNIFNFNDKMYLLYGKLSFEQNTVILEYLNQQENIVKIPDLKIYLASTSDISHIGQSFPENVEFDTFIKKNLEDYIRTLIRKDVKIQKNFAEFVHTQIPKWIDNVITAFDYQEREHYVVHEGLIKPVDYNSTGIVQSSTNWSDGLHQFLQLKHNLKMTSETLTTNFLSNAGYFTRYRTNLFGLTGTLGSEKAKQVLIDVYKVDLVIIPTSHKKQYHLLPDILTINETDWLNEIYRSAVNESRKERGTLVICETINDSIVIAEKLRQGYRSSAIKLYTMNNMNQEKNIETVKPGEIIIATNLAGRGTDIKTNEIEKDGGLHVIVTFMPPNKRVEEQAFGRTARQGKRGTGQRILNAANLTNDEHFDIKKITKLRDDIEARILEDFQKHELKVIILKDKLFVKFCSLLNEIRQKIREKNSLFTKGKNKVKSVVKYVTPSVFESNVLLSIEEQWAMFLRKIDNQKFPINIEQAHKDYEEFSRKIIQDYENDRVIKNPYYHIVIANDLVINDSLLNTKYDQAMKHFDRAIELDPDNTPAAFAGKGWLLLKGIKRWYWSNRQMLGYKEAAIETFNKALELVSQEMAALFTMQTLLQKRCPYMNTALSKQLTQKVNILGSYLRCLENVVTVIKKSQRLIQITEIQECPNIIGEHTNSSEVSPKQALENCNSRMFKRVISYDGIEKGSGEKCNIRSISYNDLNRYETSIANGKEIAVIKENEDQFTVIYKQKRKNELHEWVVDDHELINSLFSLPYDGTILDRDVYSKIYNLIYEKITSKNGHIREEFLTPLQELRDSSVYEVTFNDLTVRHDMGTIDQAIETIDDAVPEPEGMILSALTPATKSLFKKNNVLNEDYQYISICISQIHAERLKKFLNPDIEIRGATKEVALAQLKDKKSFFHRHLLPESLSTAPYEVDLEIISDNDKSEVKFGLQEKDAIKIIQQRTEDNLQFNLTFISANEISKVLDDMGLFRSNLTVEFIELNGQNVKEKLTKIKSNSITLEISDSKERLLEVIRTLKIKYVELYFNRQEKQNNRSIAEIVDKITAQRKIKEITDDYMIIKLIDIDKITVEEVISICPNANFNINFFCIEFESLLKGLEDELVSIHFDTLRKEAAKTLITQIRKENFDFSLLFKSLTSHQAKQLIEIASIEQENIEINKFKTVSELFMNELRPNLELLEFSGRGIEYLLEISEKKFIPWRSITAVCALAAVQMAVGGALMATGYGATIGMGLFTEGLADFVIAGIACYQRKFSWSDYGKQKAVSLVISVVSMGFSAIKDAGKGIQTVVAGVGQEIVEQTGTQVVVNSKAVNQVLVQTGQMFEKLTIKQIGVTAGSKSLICLNKAVNLSSNFALEQLKPQISARIQSKVNSKFCESNLLEIVRKMYVLDSYYPQQQLKEKIHKIIAEIINPEHGAWRVDWVDIGNLLCKALLKDAALVSGAANLGIKLIGTLNAIDQINTIIENVRDRLIKKLSQLDQETLSMHHILHRHCGVNKEDATEILTLLKKQDIIDEVGITDENEKLDEQVFFEKLNRADFGKFDQYKKQIVGFLKLLHIKMLNIEFHDFSEIIKLTSDMITEHALRITEAQLVSS